MVQNQLSIRFTKACWLVNKNFELMMMMMNGSIRVRIVPEYFASGLMRAIRSPRLAFWPQKKCAAIYHCH